MSRETEIRFTAPAQDLARLARGSALHGFSMGRPAVKRLLTTYYDTPNHSLGKAGLTLRVRKNGHGFVQTVKDESSGALVSDRREAECDISSPDPDTTLIPDSALRDRIEALRDGAPFEAIIETQIRRTTRAIKSDDGDEIELALDKGEIRPLIEGHAPLPVNELELELKHGAPVALYEVARRLSRKAPLTVSPESKSARGMRALEGESVHAHKPERATLDRDCTAEEAFAATLSHCLRHLTRNVAAVTEARLPEGVHQLRVGLRRLRAALTDVQGLEALRDRAKTLSNLFGDTRELDVFATELLPTIEEVAKLPGLAPLRLILEELRRESWERSIELVQSDDFTGFLIDLASAIETRLWREGLHGEDLIAFECPARIHAAEMLDDRLKQACKRAKHLSSLDVQQRHRLRIALKKLRYSAEFFAPLFPSRHVSPFLKRLSRLQDLFGTMNDAATSAAILRRIVEHARARGGTELLEAAAFVEGWHQSRVGPTWDHAKQRWKRFAKAEPFWR